MAVYIATHKSAPMPKAPWLKPIGLGGYSDEQVTLSANDGDNIGHKHRGYCELTATYWLWKHCRDPYVGLCHYRRLFAFVPLPMPEFQSQAVVKAPAAPEVLSFLSSADQERRLVAMLDSYDMVVPLPMLQYPSMAQHFRQAHGDLYWAPFQAACRDEFGDIANALDTETRFHYGNMLVARAEVFQDYCTRLFRVLDRVVDEVGEPAEVPGVRYQPYRYPGYLGERFTNLYLLATRARYMATQSIWFD